MSDKRLPLLVLLGALAALGGSIGWAVAKNDDSSWKAPRYASQMMGYTPGGQAKAVRGPGDAKAQAQRFADRLGLRADEVLQFERNYYVKLVDSKGNGATEVLVDPPTGFVSLEYGPAMMWNTRYGMMSGRSAGGMMGRSGKAYGGMMGSGQTGAGMMGNGMMGGGMMGQGQSGGMMGQGYGRGSGVASPPSTKPSVSVVEAHTLAQRWLDANQSGTKVEAGGDSFPGYYTLETLRDGRINGMLSVNAYTGTVWPHWWHGRFVAKTE